VSDRSECPITSGLSTEPSGSYALAASARRASRVRTNHLRPGPAIKASDVIASQMGQGRASISATHTRVNAAPRQVMGPPRGRASFSHSIRRCSRLAHRSSNPVTARIVPDVEPNS
jgi:hypothetical protein